MTDKCVLVRTGVNTTDDYLEDDACVAQVISSTPPAPAPAASSQPPPRKPARRPLAIEDGSNEWIDLNNKVAPPAPAALYTRKGQKICPDFQKGLCIGTDGMSRCLRDGVSLHVCAICFDNRHGAYHPYTCNRSPGGGGAAPADKKRRSK